MAGRRVTGRREAAIAADEDARLRRRRRTGIVAGVLLALGVLAGVFFLFGPSTDTVAIPDVSGQTQDVALRTLTTAGLRPTVVAVASPADQLGRVVGTDPGGGVSVPTAAVVTMRVGRGPDRVGVPSLVGQTADQAQAAVRAVGLVLTPVPQTRDVDDQNQVGRVLAQDPPPGTLLDPGQAIGLTVGRLRETLRVPDVTGQDQGTARSTLEGVGLTVSVTQVDGTQKAGLGRLDLAGRGRDRAARVGGDPAGVEGQPAARAVGRRADDLAGPGHASRRPASRGNLQQTSQAVTDPTQEGKVLSQTPTAGSAAGTGDTISVVVGRYSGGSSPTSGLFPNGLFPGGN